MLWHRFTSGSRIPGSRSFSSATMNRIVNEYRKVSI